jgi:hypothetical protein
MATWNDTKTTDLDTLMPQLVRTYGAVRLVRALATVITDPTTRALLARTLEAK